MANEPNWQDSPPPQEWQDTSPPPARKPAQSAPPPGLLQRMGQGIEKWWTTPRDEGQDPYTLAKLGYAPRTTESPREGVAKTAKMGMAATAPFAVPAMAASPGATLLGLGGAAAGGTVGGSAGRYLGGKVGAPQLGEDVGGLAGGFFGGMAGGAAGSPGARRALARTIIDPATLEPRPIAKAIPLLGKERATAIGDILDPNLPKVRNMTAAADASFQNRADELGAIGKQESQFGQENAKAVQRNLQEGEAVPVSQSPGGYAGPPKQVDPVLQAVREGRASKIPTRMPPTVPPPKPSAFLGMTSTQGPLGKSPTGAVKSPSVEFVDKFSAPEPPPAKGRTRIGSFDFPTTVPEAESVPGAKGEAWSMQRTSSPELQRAVESGDPGAIETARRLNPNYRPIIIPKGASLESKPLPFTGPPSSPATSRPLTISNEMNIRWASDGVDKVSIPNSVPDEAIEEYARPKLQEQATIRSTLLGKKGAR